MVRMEGFSRSLRSELKRVGEELDMLRSEPNLLISRQEDPNVCDLVLAGGGAKGVAHIGALWAMDRLGIRFKRLAGTSAGAIMAAIIAGGFSVEEMSEELMKVDFVGFRDGFWDQRLPKLARIAAVSSSYGMYEGKSLQSWMENLLVSKGANTFGRLPRKAVGMLSELPEEDGPRLQIMASDVTHSCELIMPRDLSLPRYGSLRPNFFPVSAAVRMSISVPFFFTPYKLHRSLIVDGAFASNLPLEVFDREDPDDVRWPTFGINLASAPSPPNPTTDLFHFGLAIFDTMKYGQSRMSILQYPTRMCRLIDVPTGEVRTLDFDIKSEVKERLFLNGAEAVLRTLKGQGGAGLRTTWDFNRYIDLRKRWSFPSTDELYC